MVVDPLLDFPAPMDGSSIPQQDHRSPKMPEQVFEEGLHIQSREIAGATLKIEGQPSSFGRDRQGADCRDPVLFVEIVNERRLSFWGPGAGHVGDEQEARLIEEDQMGATSFGVFLYAASGTASSAQSPLRPVGEPGGLASGNSIPLLEASATHDGGDSARETVSGPTGQCASRSTVLFDSRAPMVPKAEGSPTCASGAW